MNELVDYVKRMRVQGYSEAQIRVQLLKYDYTNAEADEALKMAGASTFKDLPPKPSFPPKPDHSISPKIKGYFKNRSPLLVFLLSLVTFGLYAVYWFVVTSLELREVSRSAPNPKLLWLLLIPFVNFAVYIYYSWVYSKAVNEVVGFSQVGLFLLLAFFTPVGAALAQNEFNKK